MCTVLQMLSLYLATNSTPLSPSPSLPSLPLLSLLSCLSLSLFPLPLPLSHLYSSLRGSCTPFRRMA